MIAMRKGFVFALCLAVAMAVGTGCHHKKPTPINPELTPPSAKAPAEPTTGTGQPNVDLENLLFSKDNGKIKPIYFDFDRYDLRPDALSTLKANVDVLKQYPDVIVQVEGHCDERGTPEYNMALGDRRAQSTREQMIRLGISGDRIVTISYGKEAPVDPGHNEAAWAKNRRCEFAQGHKK